MAVVTDVMERQCSLYVATPHKATDPWVIDNVEPLIGIPTRTVCDLMPENLIGSALRGFLSGDDTPVIIADSPVDIERFCRAYMTDKDGGYLPNDRPLMRFEVHDVDAYPTKLKGAVQHNAWWDAMALRERLAA
jgi:hypothetical protein